MSGRIYLLTGGTRSGKSRRGQELAAKSASQVIYVATCETGSMDPEMDARIARHQSDRPKSWKTIENRFDLSHLITEFHGATMLLDCLTLWLSHWQGRLDARPLNELEEALKLARNNEVILFIVSNELGMGLVPISGEDRAFRDLCGEANQLVA